MWLWSTDYLVEVAVVGKRVLVPLPVEVPLGYAGPPWHVIVLNFEGPSPSW